MLTRIQKGNNIYAVYELDETQTQIDKISLMMINSNQQHNIGLAPITFEKMNGIYYKMLFDVTGKVTLREYIGKHISQEDFRQMLLNLIDTIENFDEYMIDVNQILLDMDCVYINTIDHSIAFLCIALKDIVQTYRPYEFFRTVVQNSHVNLKQDEVSYFNYIWNITDDENVFSLSNMKSAIKAAEKSKKTDDLSQKADSTEVFEVQQPPVITVSQSQQDTPLPQPTDFGTDEQKDSGFLGKLFSGSLLRKNNQSEKKKPASTGYQGGLAGLKSGISKAGRTSRLGNKENQEIPDEMPNPASQRTEQTQSDRPIYQGTTVLKGKMPDYMVEPEIQSKEAETSQPVILETTALNQKVQNQYETEIPETTVLNKKAHTEEFPETTVLKPVPKKTACLIQLREKRVRFFIHKSVFVIGRGTSGIDCAVNDNTNVSRHHADILQSDSGYYLSVVTQHEGITYLNSTELKNGDKVKLSDGDKILLGNEEFEFRIV